MKLTVIGCSGSLPGPASPASCYLVQADQEERTWNLLLDLGSGALGPLQRHIGLGDIDAVVLSHLHPDHCIDLCGLYVAQKYRPAGHRGTGAYGRAATSQSGRRGRRIPVYGPSGTKERIHRAYDDLSEPEGMTAEFDFRTVSDAVPFEVGPFRVTPYLVRHPVEAYGLRVEADGASLAYTGDTDACDSLLPLCHDASLVLADSAFLERRDETEGVHLSGRRAALAAVDAGGVRRLMLTHIPPWNDPAECQEEAAQVWPGEVELAVSDATYEL